MYITLMDGAGNEVLSKRLKMDLNTDAAQLFIGVLCDEPERLSYLEQVGVNYSMLRTKTIDLSVYDLPDTELGLDQLDVLLITDLTQRPLQKSRQRRSGNGYTVAVFYCLEQVPGEMKHYLLSVNNCWNIRFHLEWFTRSRWDRTVQPGNRGKIFFPWKEQKWI